MQLYELQMATAIMVTWGMRTKCNFAAVSGKDELGCGPAGPWIQKTVSGTHRKISAPSARRGFGSGEG